IGLAPQWETGACDTTCQQYVSACMLAHVNTSGQHIAVWLDNDSPAIGWGQNSNYPYQEGSFFGDIFVSPPAAYFCNRKDFDNGVVAGRLGATQGGAPYMNPYGYSGAMCNPFCAAHGTDGFNSCTTYNPWTVYSHVITVWRNFDPGTKYKVCNKINGKCLDINNGSTADQAQLVQRGYYRSNSQKWLIAAIGPGKYNLTNVNSAKAAGSSGGATSDGTPLVQIPYGSTSTDNWYITSMGDATGLYKLTSSASSSAAA